MTSDPAAGGVYGRTRIKVCGMTRLADASMAVAAGVDALGFIFATKSPRWVTADTVQAISAALPPFINLVGVFVNADAELVADTCRRCRLSHAQLHGQEDPDYCRTLAALSPVRLIKAFRVRPDSTAADFAPYQQWVSAYLLDTYVAGQDGGTGLTFDWEMISSFKLARPVILAGGLGAANAAAAVRAVRPFAVDLNSGVEDLPGIKNQHKLEEVVAQVRLADCCPR